MIDVCLFTSVDEVKGNKSVSFHVPYLKVVNDHVTIVIFLFTIARSDGETGSTQMPRHRMVNFLLGVTLLQLGCIKKGVRCRCENDEGSGGSCEIGYFLNSLLIFSGSKRI